MGLLFGATILPFTMMVGAFSSRTAMLLMVIFPLERVMVLPCESSITTVSFFASYGVMLTSFHGRAEFCEWPGVGAGKDYAKAVSHVQLKRGSRFKFEFSFGGFTSCSGLKCFYLPGSAKSL